MNKAPWLSIALIVTSLLVTACASPHARKHQDPDPDRMVDHMSRHLDLSDAQDREVRAIIAAYRPQLEAVCDGLRDSRDALIEYRDPDHDRAAVRADAARLGGFVEEGAILLVTMRSEIRTVLDAEQIGKLERAHERYMQRGDRPRHRKYMMRHGLLCRGDAAQSG